MAVQPKSMRKVEVIKKTFLLIIIKFVYVTIKMILLGGHSAWSS